MKRTAILFSVALGCAAMLGACCSAASPIESGFHESAYSAVHTSALPAEVSAFEVSQRVMIYSTVDLEATVAHCRISEPHGRAADKRIEFAARPYRTFAVLRMEPRLPDIATST